MHKLIQSAFHVIPNEQPRMRNCYTRRTRNECVLDFAKRIKICDSGCWEWTGSKQRFGHGILRFMGTNIKSHRLALMLKMGLDKIDGCVCHHCDNPSCVNPDHLYIGDHATNANDRDSKNRRKAPRGEQSATSKLSDKQVSEIREKYQPFIYTTKMLSEEYRICMTQVKNIVSGRQRPPISHTETIPFPRPKTA